MTIVSILVATVIAFIFSSIYYSPALMWNIWQKSVGIKMDSKSFTWWKMVKIFGTTFLLYFIQYFILAFFMSRVGADTVSEAIIISIMSWMLIESSALVKGMYEQRNILGTLIWVFEDLIRIIIWALIIVWMM